LEILVELFADRRNYSVGDQVVRYPFDAVIIQVDNIEEITPISFLLLFIIIGTTCNNKASFALELGPTIISLVLFFKFFWHSS